MLLFYNAELLFPNANYKACLVYILYIRGGYAMLFDNLLEALKPPPNNLGILRSCTRGIEDLLGDYIKGIALYKAPYLLVPNSHRLRGVKGAAYRASGEEL